MKVIFHKDYCKSDYADDSAAAPGRMEAITKALRAKNSFEFVEPKPATRQDILIAHERNYVESVEKNETLFKAACLAAGGAILASEHALQDEPAFACVRPPGHHAYKDMAWGHCFFSNMAIAVKRLLIQNKIKTAFIIDIDAHTGDGTKNVLSEFENVKILNVMAEDSVKYKKAVEAYIKDLEPVDIIGISAGFDSHVEEVGKKLTTFDYFYLAALMRKLANKMGHSRVFATLEGGYDKRYLGKNVASFCEGLDYKLL